MKPVISNRRSSIQTTAEQKHETSLQSTKQQELFFLGSKKVLSFEFRTQFFLDRLGRTKKLDRQSGGLLNDSIS